MKKSPIKYKLTIEDESHLAEVWSRRFSAGALWLTGAVTVIVLLVVSGMIIMFTPLHSLLPGYLKESQRSATEEGLLRLDSLMAAYEVNKAYIDNYIRVLDTERETGDSAAVRPVSRDLSADSLMTQTEAEKKFVSQMEEHERFNISVLAPLAAESMMFYPINGDGIYTKESENSEEGVIILPPHENIMCAADGSVIALYYSAAEQGYVVVVQHNHGFVTSYTHTGAPMVGVGDNVNAGQMIAMSPKPDSKGIRQFRVRMWHNGLPIVPYQYLSEPTHENLTGTQSYESPRGRL